MYHFSRSIYRELAPEIIEERDGGTENHERVLRSCENCVERLATDWHYFARPTKTLFNDIRIYFPMSAQLHVYKTVDRYMCFAREYFANNPVAERLECRATTRRGTPCQRTPLPSAPGDVRSCARSSSEQHAARSARGLAVKQRSLPRGATACWLAGAARGVPARRLLRLK